MKGVIGVTKEIDNLGRIVIPKEFRDRLMLDGEVEVLLTAEGVLIRNSMYKLVKIKSGENSCSEDCRH